MGLWQGWSTTVYPLILTGHIITYISESISNYFKYLSNIKSTLLYIGNIARLNGLTGLHNKINQKKLSST